MSDENEKLVETIEGLNKDFQEFKKVNDEKIAELKSSGVDNGLLEEKLAGINKAMEAKEEIIKELKTSLEQIQLSAKRQNKIYVDEKGQEINLEQKAKNFAKRMAISSNSDVKEFSHEDFLQRKAAFQTFYRKGEQSLSPDEYKSMSVGSDVDGGFFVNYDMSSDIIKRMYDNSPVRQYAKVVPISSNGLTVIQETGKPTAYWENEATSVTDQQTPQIGKATILAHSLLCPQLVTSELLEDSQIDVENWLSEAVSAELLREEGSSFVNGNGIGKPTGFLSGAITTGTPNSVVTNLQAYKTGNASTLGNGDVLREAAIKGLRSVYRNNANWFMNRNTAFEVAKLKDSDGNYLWQRGLENGQPANLVGFPVVMFDDMPDVAANSNSIVFGDMQAAYIIVDKADIAVIRDGFSKKPAIEFLFRSRTGGLLVNADALKVVQTKA